MTPKRLIVVVTGANSGIGFVTCERLLKQLSQPDPSDAWPQFEPNETPEKGGRTFEFSPSAGITIIMACRSQERAEAARKELFQSLDTHIAKLRPSRADLEYAATFRENVEIAIHRLDLSSVRSVLHFGEEVSQRYPYVSHLLCNAGVAAWDHIDFPQFFWMLATEGPINTVESPAWSAQKSGVMSEDNLGWVWQSNVFGHYVLFRQLQPLLSAFSSGESAATPARVLWMSSIEAQPTYDADEDWQLTQTAMSYQGSKYQQDILCAELARRTRGDDITPDSPFSGKIHHILVSPGIRITELATNVHQAVPLAMLWIWLLFQLARICGSRNIFTASVYKVAVCPVHMCLVPLAYIPNTASRYYAGHPPGSVIKFGAQNTLAGSEYVGIVPVSKRLDRPNEGSRLLERCERLYQTFLRAEKKPEARPESGNGHA